MAAIEKIRTLAIDNGWSSAFANGFSDGQTAREQHRPLTAYVRVGIDDYAKGYRQGFFDRTASAAPSNRTLTRQVAGL